MMISQILARQGLTNVIGAEDGRKAVEEFKCHKPDLTLMDITMPELDGLAALAEILKIDPLAKVVMCSAVANENIVKAALQAGAAGFLAKPFRPDELLDAVTKQLSSQ